jgi:hypothetical protein
VCGTDYLATARVNATWGSPRRSALVDWAKGAEVVPVLDAMGKDIRKNGALTREQHWLIQDVSFNG